MDTTTEPQRLCRMCHAPLTKRQARYCSRSCQVGGQNRDRARQQRAARRVSQP